MADDIDKKPIARIYRLAAEDAEGAQGVVEGMGFLISDRHVLTCAHVVESALGHPKNSHLEVAPGNTIKLDFPFADREGEDCLARSGQVMYWRPVNDSVREADIAVLRLNKPVPAAVRSATLAQSPDSSWRAYGSPKDGYWCKGTFSDVTERGWRQMDDAKIVEGFSGTPVWHGRESVVTGMVVARMGGVGYQPAFMLPNELLEPAIRFVDADTLFDYLSASFDSSASKMKQAYRQCLPEMWEGEEPDNFRHMLAILGQDIADAGGANGEAYSALVQFAATLVVQEALLQDVRDDLVAWLGIKINDIAALLAFVKQRQVTVAEDSVRASVLFQVSFSQSDDLNAYMVKAWLVTNPACYSPKKIQGCKPLMISDDAEKTYTKDEIPGLLKQCLDQVVNESEETDPTLEIFLPLLCLNDAVEADWELDGEEDELDDPLAIAEPSKIGWRYRVILRSSDRVGWPYKKNAARRMADWYERWKQVDGNLSTRTCRADDVLVNGSDSADMRSLTQRLTPLDTVGVKFSHVPSVARKKEIATTLGLSVPVAIWLRESIPGAQQMLDSFLEGHLHEMLENAKKQRCDDCNPETDLGCHLALLWDNPNLLPPFERDVS